MRCLFTLPIRRAAIVALAVGGLLALAAPVSAQVGFGARLAWVTPDVDADVDKVRFVGGQMRLLSGRIGFEVSLDRRSESLELLNQKVTEIPLQTSLLLRMGSGRVTPFLLGGPGWYRRKVEPIDGPGCGRQHDRVRLARGYRPRGPAQPTLRHPRRLPLHLPRLQRKDEDEGFVGKLLPGHRGSMWTLGASFYF